MHTALIDAYEQWIENVGETGCLEPAFKQNTNDDIIIRQASAQIQILFYHLTTISVLSISADHYMPAITYIDHL